MRCSLAAAVALAALVGTVPVSAAQAPPLRTGPSRELPSTVVAAFEKAYPAATITAASTERKDGKMAFRLEAQDRGRRRVLVYDLKGEVIEAAEQVDEPDLPPAVAAAIRQHRASYVRGMRVTQGAIVRYELMLRGTRKTTMVLKEDGTIITTR